jgi:hypothetical protein
VQFTIDGSETIVKKERNKSKYEFVSRVAMSAWRNYLSLLSFRKGSAGHAKSHQPQSNISHEEEEDEEALLDILESDQLLGEAFEWKCESPFPRVISL